MKKVRADVLLVTRGLAPSRERARAFILAGDVFCGDRRVDKAGERLDPEAPLTVRRPDHPYVSRGGVKLEGALDAFELDPSGLVVADVGASTGGFTDCVLMRGAARVYAIDVGYGQLHAKLRGDPRVIVMERTNARHLRPDDLPERVDLALVDASFIGLDKLLPAIAGILADDGRVLALVKPQFQLDRERVGPKGVVRSEADRQAAVDAVVAAASHLGLAVRAQVDSGLPGPRGNREVFLLLVRERLHDGPDPVV